MHHTNPGGPSQGPLAGRDREIPAAIRYANLHGYAGLLMPGKPDKRPRVTFAGLRESTPGDFRRWLWLCDNRWDDDQVWLLRTGWIQRESGPLRLVVLDADTAAGVALIESQGRLQTAWQVDTPRGRHFYYAAGPGLDRCSYGIDGIDVKTGINSYIVAPRSVTAAGVYKPARDFGVGAPPTLAPEMLHELKCLAPRPRRPRRNLHTPDAPAAGLSELNPVAPERPKPPSERPDYTPRDDAPPHFAPICVDPARCSYQTPCIGTRNNTLWTVCSRRVMRNYLKGDDRVTAYKMLAYARAVNRYNFGHEVAPGEKSHPLHDAEIREMLPRICAAVAAAFSDRGYRESQKRCSNRAHMAKAFLRLACYAAIIAGYDAGLSKAELIALSGEYRERPYCLSQINRIIANRGRYRQPRAALPDDANDGPDNFVPYDKAQPGPVSALPFTVRPPDPQNDELAQRGGPGPDGSVGPDSRANGTAQRGGPGPDGSVGPDSRANGTAQRGGPGPDGSVGPDSRANGTAQRGGPGPDGSVGPDSRANGTAQRGGPGPDGSVGPDSRAANPRLRWAAVAQSRKLGRIIAYQSDRAALSGPNPAQTRPCLRGPIWPNVAAALLRRPRAG